MSGDVTKGASVMLLGDGPFTLFTLRDAFRLNTGTLPDDERCGSPGLLGEVLVFARDPLSMKLEPGRSPNLGKLNWKSLIPVGACEYVVGDTRGPDPLVDNLFLYSLTSTFKRSTSARRRPFSWFVDSEAFSNSSTLVSRSLRCRSFRSRKARCAARF